MAQLHAPRFSEALRRLAGLQGPEAAIDDVSPQLVPTADLHADLWGYPDLLAPAGVKLCSAARNQTAQAGVINRVRLRNRAASGMLANLIAIAIWTDGAVSFAGFVNVSYGATSADLGGVADARTRDLRLGEFARCATSVATTAPDLSNIGVVLPSNVGSGQLWQLCPVVLPPNHAVDFSTDVTNTGMLISFLWTERPALPEETRF